VQRHDFAYDLPPELIAQTPLAERSASRLLVVEPTGGRAGDLDDRRRPAGTGDSGASEPTGAAAGDLTRRGRLVDVGNLGDPASASAPEVVLRDCKMRDFPTLLKPGDLLVFNDTKVVAARLVGTKPSGGRVEIFLERVTAEAENQAFVQLRASKPIREGLEVSTVGGTVTIRGRQDDLWRVEFPGSALEFFEKWGDVPLPPYIHRTPDENDRERYQSIFARERGAVAAPTASLHFDESLIRRIEEMGVNRAFVTLHVGAGTFQPVRIDDLNAHVMHAERVSVSAATCSAIEKTRAAGGRVIAIGTTVIRALESAALAQSELTRSQAGTGSGDAVARGIGSAETASADAAPAEAASAEQKSAHSANERLPYGRAFGVDGARPGLCLPSNGWAGDTRLFIRPGFQFRVADALLTNFHLPESTLLMLVCAFAGMAPVLKAYEHAVRERYRFFSYGDAMFLTRKMG
jgi:S-adenosylmethionine:tRNA ribosyltransferase-isomerase